SVCPRPCAAYVIIARNTRRAAATGVIRDHVIKKVLIPGIPKLMRITWLKEKRITRSNLGYPILVAHAAAPGNDEVKLRFSRMRVIGTKEFALWNSDQRQIKRMPLR